MDIGRPLSYAQAVKEVSAGRNVFTVTRAEAEVVARVANSNKKTIGPEIDKNKSGVIGYYYHYHVSRKNKGHVWYLFG